MSEKTYTAQELRQTAEMDFHVTKLGLDDRPNLTDEIHSMLRQAADDAEELTNVKASKERWMQYQETAAGERNACIDELRKKDAEITQLKARLEAVVKDFAQFKKDLDDRLTEAYVFASETTAKSSFDKIYGGVRDAVNYIREELGIDSAARGEASGEIEAK